MGQSTSSALSGPVALASTTGNYLADLGNELVYEKSLGQSRFLKAIRAVHRSSLGRVVVKVRPVGDSQTYERFAKQLRSERDALQDVPNALPYQRLVSHERAGYLLRQWIANNLYDRISTRPFLSLIEKKWIAFQLLTALRDCHARGIAHGDLKSENILCNTSNWIYVADFAPFKPTYIPLNDPADFAYFFDASGRRTCNLAPERFYDAKEAKPTADIQVTEAMDVFSAGCVIAEICSDGVSPFTLSQMFKYRAGEYTPNLARMEDDSLKNLVTSMLSLDPTNRTTFGAYLTSERGNTFPDVFFRLHAFVAEINDVSAPPYHGESSTGPASRAGSDEKLDRLWSDLDLVASMVETSASLKQQKMRFGLFPVELNVPAFDTPLGRGAPKVDDPAALIILTVICANIRNCAWPSSIVRALDLLLALSLSCADDTRLNRILPYMIAVIDDSNALVRAAALRNVTQLLLLTDSVTPANTGVFTEYILPNIAPLATDSEDLVRATFAQCLAPLADVGARLLDLSRSMLIEADTLDATYDAAMKALQEQIKDLAISMLVDSSSAVKRGLLRGLAPLCVFLGRTQTADVLLSHSITYLNDPDWALRAAFFEASVGLAACVGGKSVEQYILPLMMQALTDAEDAVIARVLASLVTLIEIGLVRKAGFWDIFDAVLGLICHPVSWIRQGAAAFIAAASLRVLPGADVWYTLYPALRSLLASDISAIDEVSILSSVLPPVPLAILEAASAWAKASARASPFWKGSAHRSADDIEHLRQLSSAFEPAKYDKQLESLRPWLLRRATKTQGPPLIDADPLKLLQGNVSLQSLGVTPENVFYGVDRTFSIGKGPPPTSRLHQTEGWPRRMSSNVPSTPPSRTTSDVHAVEDLRRRLALSGGSSSASLSSLSRASAPGHSRRESMTADALSPDAMASSQTTIRPGPVPARPWSRAGGFEVGRVSPAIAADSAVALGTIDMEIKSPSQEDRSSFSTPVRQTPTERFSTTYEGSDPGIRQLLERTYLESAAEHEPEFGPRISSTVARKRAAKPTIRPKADQADTREKSSRPEGTLVAQMAEHTAAIRSLAISPDHVFFATGSDDGTVRIWDAMRLEKSATGRSRQTLRHTDRVTAIVMLENSHCLASASSDGQLLVHRVDVDLTGALPKYSKAHVVRQMTIETPNDYITCMSHAHHGSSSRLLYGTALGQIGAVDLRSMRPLFSLQNDRHQGPLTALLVESKGAWLLAGTVDGHLALWDLRFHLLIKTWSVSGGPIHRILLHPARGRGRWVIVGAEHAAASKTLFQVWDIDLSQLVERYGMTGKVNAVAPLSIIEANKDERRSAAQALAALVNERQPDEAAPKLAVLDVATGAHTPDLHASTRSSLTTSTSGELVRPSLTYLITTSDDQKLRYWDLDDFEHSALLLHPDEPAPSYTSVAGPVMQYLEVAGRSRSVSKRPGEDALVAQQARMKSPRDVITAVGILELPYRCVVTGDRTGVVRVYA